jgi:hypothetical protein
VADALEGVGRKGFVGQVALPGVVGGVHALHPEAEVGLDVAQRLHFRGDQFPPERVGLRPVRRQALVLQGGRHVFVAGQHPAGKHGVVVHRVLLTQFGVEGVRVVEGRRAHQVVHVNVNKLLYKWGMINEELMVGAEMKKQ